MKGLAQRRQDAVDFTKRVRDVLKTSMNQVQQRWTRSERLKDSTTSVHIYEIRPRADKRGFDLISDVLRLGAAVVLRVKRNRLRKVSQPFTQCCDSRFR
jgi:hypothetical protein